MLIGRVVQFLSDWLSRSGDNTFWSWVITVFYLITGILAIFYVNRIRSERQNHFLWVCITVFLLLMGINKQLDVQTLILMSVRFLIGHFRLWHYWRIFHYLVSSGLIAVFLISGILLVLKSGKSILQSLLALSGVLLLIVFIIMRANYIYMQHIHSLELAGITLVLADLLVKLKSPSNASGKS